LTLTGPGGVGKTRLALAIAADVADRFADGIVWVDFAPVQDSGLVPATVAQALGIVPRPGQPIAEEILRHLRRRQCLLLLDNCEHVLLPVAELASTLLTSSPALQILATSRAPLRIRGEQEFPVEPLPLPAGKSLEALAGNASIRLLVQRAQSMRPSFVLDAAIAQDVVDICRRLDGLPLAIELAAAHLRVLTPSALAARLERRLPLLAGGPRDAPARQQTIRDTLAWSYDLLSHEEQAVFRRLAVFSGGFTPEMAQAVHPDGQASAMLPLLERLAEQSLIRAISGSGEPRLNMLETIREFGLERLTACGEADEAQRRHALWCVELAEEAEPAFKGPDQGRWRRLLEAELPNMRAALTWLRTGEEVELGLRLAGALAWFWWVRGHPGEGRDWLEWALHQRPGASPDVRVKALAGIAPLAMEQEDYPRAVTYATESLAISRASGDRAGMARALRALAMAAHDQGHYAEAVPLFEESLACYEAVGDDSGIANILDNLGRVACFAGDHDRAAAFLARALDLSRAGNDTYQIASALSVLGELARRQGDHSRATALYQEALILRRRLGERRLLAECLRGLARIAAATQQPERAARLAGAEDALREAIGTALSPLPEGERYKRDLDALRNVLGAEAFTVAWREGRALPLEDALDEAAALVRGDPMPQSTPVRGEGAAASGAAYRKVTEGRAEEPGARRR
ncbi:MAG: ATP-binding protein, partial [Thermomicrobiales bacterium]